MQHQAADNDQMAHDQHGLSCMFGKDTYTSLVVSAGDALGARRLKEFLSKDYKQASVQAQVETEYYESLSNTNQQ